MSISHEAHTRGRFTTDSWITPKWLTDRLGPFDLAPCACSPQPWQTASKMFTEAEDGLSRLWNGFVWCNPPYGKQANDWLKRMAEHGNGIALIFARTETQMFFDNVWPHAKSVLFIKGRLTFFRPDGTKPKGNSGGPSVMIAYGNKAHNKLKTCVGLGVHMERATA